METWREGARTGHTHEPNEVTIQLDGLGRQLSELIPEPSAPEGSDGPVFVDESGRRSKTLRRLGWVLAAICVGYAVTLVVALLGGNSSAPVLPLSGQEEQQKAEEVRTPATLGETPGALVSPGATQDILPSATRETEGSATGTGGAVGAGNASATGTGSAASVRVEPSAQLTGAASSTGAGEPAGETSASAPAAGSGTPSTDPATVSPDPVTSPATTPDAPVQEREGAS
ncbi:hypothetical protein ABT025_21520 [Streptomyces sp. NPDC002809]|uniref:hypothetical protein n=1 Tax=Streptomyces sp. NPDC002809 TaxID=3154433 RepID=UPI00331E7B3E